MSSHDDQKLIREMKSVLSLPEGEKPDRSVKLSRRTFMHKSLLAGGVGAGALGMLPLLNTMDVAFGATKFRFAWISDTHLYPKTLNSRFVDKTIRAIKEVNAMSPKPDFLIFGGDLGQQGAPSELKLGAELLKELKVKLVVIPGEHDWYLDMGNLWNKTFSDSQAPWSFDHKGVRIIGLDTVGNAPDYWSRLKMTPKERMGHMEALDGSVAGAWAGLGDKQLQWLSKTLSGWKKNQPVLLFSHNPLYEYYKPWNFWVRDWRHVHEVLKGYKNVTNVHGHTHQVLYNEIGNMRFIGMLATSWPWPYAPEGVPALTKPMVRVDPGDPYDGVGWAKLAMNTKSKVENEYMMWRNKKDIFAETAWDSGTGDNSNQELHPRIADKIWPYE